MNLFEPCTDARFRRALPGCDTRFRTTVPFGNKVGSGRIGELNDDEDTGMVMLRMIKPGSLLVLAVVGTTAGPVGRVASEVGTGVVGGGLAVPVSVSVEYGGGVAELGSPDIISYFVVDRPAGQRGAVVLT